MSPRSSETMRIVPHADSVPPAPVSDLRRKIRLVIDTLNANPGLELLAYVDTGNIFALRQFVQRMTREIAKREATPRPSP